MKVCLKYNDIIYRKYEKCYILGKSPDGKYYKTLFYDGFKCPKCGLKLPFRSKYGTVQLTSFNEVFTKGISVGTSIDDNLEHKWGNKYCNEPLHKYKFTPVIHTNFTPIGIFRNGPLTYHYYMNYSKKHTNRGCKERSYSAKGYKLKNDTCYVEPMYQHINERKSMSNKINYDDEDFYNENPMYEDITPVVKFRKCRPKMNDSTRRSTGWKSKKCRKQWGGSCKHYKEPEYN